MLESGLSDELAAKLVSQLANDPQVVYLALCIRMLPARHVHAFSKRWRGACMALSYMKL